MRRFVLWAIVIVILLAAAGPALAQCPMCRQAVEGSAEGAAIARTLNLAVLVLLLPPVTLFVGIFVLFYRYRNVQGQAQAPGKE